MAEITAKMVKDLREKTGAGMMDCKKALAAANGDIEGAMENLRKAGVAKAEKKSSRTAKEGVIACRIEDGVAILAEVVCETDFVARNEKFQALVDGVIAHAYSDYDVDGDITAQVSEQKKDELTALVASIGENMQIRRVTRWKSDGQFASYMHMGGKIGVLVDVAGEADEAMKADIGMHIAAFNPTYVRPEEVPESVLAKEREIAAAQVVGRPENMIEKIVSGKVSKWYSEVCLVKQPWIRDDKSCLEKVAPKLTVRRFLRWQVGEEL